MHTSDGFIIQLVRVVNPYVKDKSKLRPVLLFHGFQCSSTLWLVAAEGHLDKDGVYYEIDHKGAVRNGSEEIGNSLGFVLATRGYDVWLSNYRGSRYSANHTSFAFDDPKLWAFSIDEMINIDLPQSIDYILRLTSRPRLAYVGHSQGNFLMFCMLSALPHYADRLEVVIANSPVIYFEKMLTPLAKLGPFKELLMNHYGPMPNIPRLQYVYANLCNNNIFWGICHFIYSAILGSPAHQIVPVSNLRDVTHIYNYS